MVKNLQVLVLGLIALSDIACTELLLPHQEVRRGSAAEPSPKRVLLLPSKCGMLHAEVMSTTQALPEVAICAPQLTRGIDLIVQSELEFMGYSVEDSEKVNATVIRHRATIYTEKWGREVAEQIMRSQTDDFSGSRFADAPPNLQKDILRELNAQAVASARIYVGAGVGLSGRRDVIVQVRLANPEGRLVWARRCTLEVALAKETSAVEKATRCVFSPGEAL